MIKFFIRCNFIPLIIFMVIVAMFFGKMQYIYILSIVLSILLLFYIIKNNNKIRISNELKFLFFSEVLLLIYMLLITTLNLNGNGINNLILLIIILIPFLLGMEIGAIYGLNYVLNGLLHLNKIMLIITIFGIIEAITKNNLFIDMMQMEAIPTFARPGVVMDNYRIFTVFHHAIVYAVMLLVSFWINVFLNKNKKNKLISLTLILVNLYLTQSRSVWIAFVITLFVYTTSRIFVHIKNSKKLNLKSLIKFKIIIIFSLLCLSLSKIQNLILNIIDRFLQLGTTKGSVSAYQRLGTIEEIISSIYNENVFSSFLGRGYGAAAIKMKSFTAVLSGFETTDNQYISILWDFGFVGCILHLAIIYLIVSNIFKKRNCEEYNVLSFIMLSFFIPMFFFELYGWYILAFIYFFILGVISLKRDEICLNRKN